MPWKEVTTMSQRQEFVLLASLEKSNISQLCHRFGISRKTGYKWLKRYQSQGHSGLMARSRRPKQSPDQTPNHVVESILKVRNDHPASGSCVNCVVI